MGRVIGLSIENLRKIRAAFLDFDGKSLIEIRGPNDAGKSTVILALEILFKGGAALPKDAVTHGKSVATVIGKIDDYSVKRVIKPDGKQTLSIEKDGEAVAKPQEFLTAYAGKLIDPEEISRLDAKEFKRTLMEYLGIDFAKTDGKIVTAEQERLVVGRQIKSNGTPQPVPKAEAANLGELLEKRKKIVQSNEVQDTKQVEIDKCSRHLDNLKEQQEGVKAERERIEREIEELQKKLRTTKNDFKVLAGRIKDGTDLIEQLPKPEPKRSTVDVESQIEKLDEQNRAAEAYDQYLQKKETYDTLQQQHAKHDAEIKELRKQKEESLQNAAMPIEGLTISDEGILHNGDTKENWSDSRAIKIAMQFVGFVNRDRNLKVMYIKRGESLDAQSLAEVKRFAEEHDFTVIIEIVDDERQHQGDGVFFIEQGEIMVGESA